MIEMNLIDAEDQLVMTIREQNDIDLPDTVLAGQRVFHRQQGHDVDGLPAFKEITELYVI